MGTGLAGLIFEVRVGYFHDFCYGAVIQIEATTGSVKRMVALALNGIQPMRQEKPYAKPTVFGLEGESQLFALFIIVAIAS
jgi:hypothetical protein